MYWNQKILNRIKISEKSKNLQLKRIQQSGISINWPYLNIISNLSRNYPERIIKQNVSGKMVNKVNFICNNLMLSNNKPINFKRKKNLLKSNVKLKQNSLDANLIQIRRSNIIPKINVHDKVRVKENFPYDEVFNLISIEREAIAEKVKKSYDKIESVNQHKPRVYFFSTDRYSSSNAIWINLLSLILISITFCLIYFIFNLEKINL